MSGVLIANVLKNMGYKLRLFMGNVDEVSLRLLQLTCNQPVTLLDPELCDGRSNLRWLFQQAASPDCLNLVITTLGGRWMKDSPFRVSKECVLLTEWLECEIIPVIFGDASSTLTVRALNEILSSLRKNDGIDVHGVLFRSVLNDREYELVDREAGRLFTVISVGSIPKNMDRDAPLLTDMFFDKAKQSIFPVKSAALQLVNMDFQVNWAFFGALANLNTNWTPQARMCEPITDSGKVNIAVARHETLTLGGDGTEHLLRVLGCNVVEVPLEGDIIHNVPIHGVYIPHGIGYLAIRKFFSNIYLKTMISRASNGNSFMMVEGGSAPILGEKITMPDSGEYGPDMQGFGVLPYDSVYRSQQTSVFRKAAATRKKLNPLISGTQEWIWGYFSSGMRLESKTAGDECLETREIPDGRRIGVDAWCKGRILASSMRLEPWSAPISFRRWLEG
jgi:cobyrinic acid a,c-diamide synthase